MANYLIGYSGRSSCSRSCLVSGRVANDIAILYDLTHHPHREGCWLRPISVRFELLSCSWTTWWKEKILDHIENQGEETKTKQHKAQTNKANKHDHTKTGPQTVLWGHGFKSSSSLKHCSVFCGKLVFCILGTFHYLISDTWYLGIWTTVYL